MPRSETACSRPKPDLSVEVRRSYAGTKSVGLNGTVLRSKIVDFLRLLCPAREFVKISVTPYICITRDDRHEILEQRVTNVRSDLRLETLIDPWTSGEQRVSVDSRKVNLCRNQPRHALK